MALCGILQRKIKKERRTALAIPGDLKEEAFCKKLIERAAQGLGGLDIIVNNAARQQTRASILDLSSEDFHATMKTNIYTPFWIIKAARPADQEPSLAPELYETVMENFRRPRTNGARNSQTHTDRYRDRRSDRSSYQLRA